MAIRVRKNVTIDDAITAVEKIGCDEKEIVLVKYDSKASEMNLHTLAKALGEMRVNRPHLQCLIIPDNFEFIKLTPSDVVALKAALATVEAQDK